MTDARKIITGLLRREFGPHADRVAIEDFFRNIEASGIRILGPDEVDLVTVEKCASIADADGRRELSWAEMSLPVSPGPVIAKDRAVVSDRIAAAIRALGRKA